MVGFADLHCHMLYGIDDGASSRDEMFEMLDASYRNGTRIICFTPHFNPYVMTCGENGIREAMEKLRFDTDAVYAETYYAVKNRYPDIRLFLGNEIMYHSEMVSELEEGFCKPLSKTKFVLVEFFENTDRYEILRGLNSISSSGYTPILAHAERYESLRNDDPLIDKIAESGTLIQLNAGAVTGKRGIGIHLYCKKLLKKNIVSLIASDAHDVKFRPPILSDCYKTITRICGTEVADKIMLSNPRKILSGNFIFQEY